PGIVLNKDGSFQRTLRYRGPDLDSATDAELVSITARLNNILKRFGTGWALFFEAERVPASQYPGARFADPASWLVDQERYAAFSADGAHHESRYYLTVLYLPPPEHEGRAERLLYERTETSTNEIEPHAQLEWFVTETDRAFQMLASILPEAEVLGDAETLTCLHAVISNRRHPVAVPDIPTHLDAVICDTPFLGGVEPKLGEQHLRVLSVLGFPNITTPGLLDALNDLGFAYRWTTRWIALDKTEATRHLTRLRRQWFAKRKSVSAILREVMFNRETALVDPDADNKAADADEALQELGADDVAFGYLTTTVVVSDRDARQASEKLLAIERIINGRGFVTIRETLNAVEAWLGSLPGNPYANVRQPIVHTYLFHRLEARFDGRPSLLILDEAWTFLDDALFAARIREWLKTLRKKNVAVVFATQSLADIERSTIAPALIESCPTRIFLPNDRALEPQAKGVYERFGLNGRQVEILSTATPKRDYYAQTARGNRLFELGLGPVALALCGASTPEDHKTIDRCLAHSDRAGFAARFLEAKGLAWAGELIERWPRPPTSSPVPLASTPIDPVQDAPAMPPSLDAGPPAPDAAARTSARTEVPPLPGLPGGPPMDERLSPFRVVPGKSKRSGRP
ncbi:MAG TPA: hypothetical protein VH913_03685, partial [Hyphomicrobiaceae bacterium]